MATFKAVILSGENFIKTDGTTNVKIRITHKGKQQYVSTKYFVPVNTEKKIFWDHATGRAKNFTDAKTINDQVHNIINSYIKTEALLGDSANWMDVNRIKAEITINKSNTNIDFFEFADSLIYKLEKAGKDKTAQWHQSPVNALKLFVRHDKLNALSITTHFLRQFEAYLLNGDPKLISRKNKNGEIKQTVTREPMTPGGVNNYMRSFRSLFNQLRKEYNDESIGLIRVPNYPFSGFDMKPIKRRNQGKSLTVEEMKKLIQYQLSDPYQVFARDMFLLMFGMIGINTKDLYFLPVQEGKRVKFERFKTGREYSIKLEKETRQIAAKYKHDTRFINVCNRYGNSHNFTRGLDIHLKKMAGALNFNLALSSNHARHTWATIARNDCRISKDDVALCLGHEDQDNRVTDDYITYDYTIIDEANRKVLNLVYEIEPDGRIA